MKKRIWKFTLRIIDTQPVEMPKGAEILTAQNQFGNVCLWALVDPDAELETRVINVLETGSTVIGGSLKYISTVQLHGGEFVFHIFESK